MEQSPSWETDRSSASQEIPSILWKLRVRYLIHKCPPPTVAIPNRTNPIRAPSHFLKIYLILSSRLHLGLPSCLFPSGLPTKTLYLPLPFSTRVTCPAHCILLEFITPTSFGEQYRSLSSSLCNFLHSSVTSSLLGPNNVLSISFWSTFSLRSSPKVTDQF